MNTLYDWLTLAMFCALVTLFLQRSLGPAVPGDRVLHYAPPAIGCAAANAAGNGGHPIVAACIMIATVAYVLIVLRPRLSRP